MLAEQLLSFLIFAIYQKQKKQKRRSEIELLAYIEKDHLSCNTISGAEGEGGNGNSNDSSNKWNAQSKWITREIDSMYLQ